MENQNDAMYNEYNALIKNGTWVLVPRPPGTNIVRSSQQLDINCDETFSLVVKLATIRTVLSLALTINWHVYQLDVKNAFLNGDLSLYWLKQAPRVWFHRFASYATRVGFSPTSSTALLQKIILSLRKEYETTDYFISVTRNPCLLYLLCHPLRIPIPNSSAFTFSHSDDLHCLNPSASPSFTQNDTFMHEPYNIATFTQTAFFTPAVHTQHTHPAQITRLSAGTLIMSSHNSGNSPRGWEKMQRKYNCSSLVSLDEHVAVQRENKVRTLLLQALPEDHMPDFHHYDDARDIWMAVKARFGGNEESKKMKKTMLKQQFAEFFVTEEEGLHKGYDRFQKILRALPSSWAQLLCSKTRGGLESISFDDLYNKLRSLELDVRIGHKRIVHQFLRLLIMIYEGFDRLISWRWKDDLMYRRQMAMLSLRINRRTKALVSVDSMVNCPDHAAEIRTGAVEKDFHGDFGVDEVFGLSTPSVFYSGPVEKESDLRKHSDKSSDSETHASCDSSLKTQTKDIPPAVDIQTLPESDVEDPNSTTGSPSFSCSENVKSPRIICNKSGVNNRKWISPASVPAGRSDFADSRNRPSSPSAGRSWSKRPAIVSAGRPGSAGWLNPAARPYFRPSSVYFDTPTNLYDPMFMDKGRWDTAVKTSAGVLVQIMIIGGIVKFGGGDGRISGKDTLRIQKLDFEMLYYTLIVLVLSEEFQLPDASQVVLRIPRKHDLYTFHISHLQPEQKVTCLVAKASLDEFPPDGH
ncbi:ribonuclease H-like domain-containing protein [Tanacetum coccineum]